jgi:hypothetical protein
VTDTKEFVTKNRNPLVVVCAAAIAVVGIVIAGMTILRGDDATSEEKFNNEVADQFVVDFAGSSSPGPTVDFTDADDDGLVDYYIFVGCVVAGADSPDVDASAWRPFVDEVHKLEHLSQESGREQVSLTPANAGVPDEPTSTMTVSVNLDDTLVQAGAQSHARQVLSLLANANPCAP